MTFFEFLRNAENLSLTISQNSIFLKGLIHIPVCWAQWSQDGFPVSRIKRQPQEALSLVLTQPGWIRAGPWETQRVMSRPWVGTIRGPGAGPHLAFTCVNLDASLSVSKASSLPTAVCRILPQGDRIEWGDTRWRKQGTHNHGTLGFLCGYYCFHLGRLSLKIQGFLYDSLAHLSFHKWCLDSMFGDLKMIFF